MNNVIKDTQDREYQVINGTSYKLNTPKKVISLLEDSRCFNNRIRITYGDIKTGQAWDDLPFTCIVGRSTGSIKIPLVIKTTRSLGGEALLDNCIVKIEYKEGNKYITVYDITKEAKY